MAGFRQSSASGPTSEALASILKGESSSFMDDVFTVHHSKSLDATYIVFNRNSPSAKALCCWTAVLLHTTGQFFIKLPQVLGGMCTETLLMMLDMAEEMGAEEAFVCVPRTSPDHDLDVEELTALDFSRVAPRPGLSPHFSLLRFEF